MLTNMMTHCKMHDAFDTVVSGNVFATSVKDSNRRRLQRQIMKNGKGEVTV